MTAFLRNELRPLNALLVALPVAVGLEVAHAPGLWVFLVSGLAIVPLAGLMGRATECLADAFGPGVGGLLNATLGNAAELIIALFALAKGPELYPLVKASLTGSIIGNVLLVLGLAILSGGLRYKRQTFNRTAAGMGTTLLALASIGLLVPTLFAHVAGPAPGLHRLSEEIAVVLAVIYVLSLVFSLKTHRHLFAGPEGDPGAAHAPEWGRRPAFAVLLGATVGVAVMSEFLVGSVTGAAEALGMNTVFVGVIVVAVVGNAAEHSTAVLAALKNKMDLAVTIAVGSSIQVALFVAPVLVFASLALAPGPALTLHFSLMEVVAVVASVVVLALVANDGESHWMEGAMMLAVYAVFALAFYHLPAAK
jgi:Ca2+:H+ antiporter